jgi:hypothetical protein
MRNAFPVITEAAEGWPQRRQRDHHGRKQRRLQRRSLLARGPAPTRHDVAPRLGGHRPPRGHGLALYDAGGLAA